MHAEHERFILAWPRWSKTDGIFLILLVVVVVGLHWETAVAGRLSLDEDTLLYFYPLRAISQDPFVGLWNPYLFCGHPRDGNPQSQLLYLPNILLHFLSAPWAYAALLVGHLALGGIGLYLLVRFFRCGPGSALVGGLAVVGGSFWRCKAMNLGNMEGNAWIPFLLLTFTYGLERGSLRWVVYAGAFASLILGAGAPHPVLYAGLLCVLFFICALFYIDPRKIRKRLFFCAAVSAVALGLGAWSWLPAWEYLPRSNRGPLNFEEAYSGSLRVAELPGILLCGLTQPDIARLDPWEGTVFFGAAGLILAGIGVWSRRRITAVWTLVLATGIGLVFALGHHTPIYPFVRKTIPGITYLNLPNRSLLLGAWSIPILIGFGAQHILDYGTHRKAHLLAAIVSALALAGVWFHMSRSYPGHWQTVLNPALSGTFDPRLVPDMEWAVWAGLVWAACTCFVVAFQAHTNWGYRPHLAILAGLILSQEIYVTPRFFFEFTSAGFFSPPPLIRWVQNHHREQGGRVLGYSKAIPVAGDIRCSWVVPHITTRLPEIFRLPEIQGYEPVYPRAYGELIRAWAGQSRASGSVRHVQLREIPPRLIDFLGVRTIIGDPAGQLGTLSQAVIQPGGSQSYDLTEPVLAKRLFVRHISDGMQSLGTGTVIGRVVIRDVTGTSREFPARFREDVAEFLPRDLAEIGRAKTFQWWPVPSRRGYRRAVHYWSRWPIDPPFPVQSVTFRNEAPVGRWVVIDMVLTDAQRDRYPRLFFDGVTEVFQNPSAFPPAWIAPSHQVIPNATDRINTLIDSKTDLRTTVILEEEPSQCGMRNAESGITDWNPTIPHSTLGAPRSAPFDKLRTPLRTPHSALRPTALTERPSSDEIICRIVDEATNHDPRHCEERSDVAISSMGFLVIAEGYSPWWRATADEQPVPVYRADHAFMAVPLTRRVAVVRLVYRPVPFYIGCALSGLTLVICVCVLAATRQALICQSLLRSKSRNQP